MSNKSITDKILDVERHIDVSQFRYAGTSIWPAIRMTLYLSSKGGSTPEGASFAKKLSFLLLGVSQWLRFTLGSVPRRSTLLLSSSHYKVVENGKKRDRIIEPFLEWMNNHGEDYSVAEFTGQYRYGGDSLPYEAHVVHIQPAFYFLSLFWRVQFRFSDISLQGDVLKLNTLLKQQGLRLKIDKAFYWRLFLLNKQAAWFERYLKRSAAKRVMLVCYYDFKSLALVWAANRLGIPSMDLQHGVQGPRHLAYAHWPSLVAADSLLLPSHFWVWDAFSFQTIAQWKAKPENILHGCNKWFMDRVVASTGEIILFTAQPLDDSIPDELIRAIQNYRGKKKWYVRLHPYQLKELPAFKARFKEAGISDRVNIDEATQAPLTSLLQRTHVHLTYYSSVALEAAYYNIPTMFLDERGEMVFKDALSPALAFYFRPQHDLLDRIIKIESEKFGLNVTDLDNIRDRFAIIKNFFA